MKHEGHAVLRAGSAEAAASGMAIAAGSAPARRGVLPRRSIPRRVLGYVGRAAAIAGMEARKLLHDPTELLTRAVQPALWLLVFGQVFTRIRAIPTGSMRYIDFMAPGILSQSVLFIAIFYGIAVIWERDLGILHKFLVSPAPRSALIVGKALSAAIRGLTQAVIVYLLALLLGVQMNWGILPLLGLLGAVMLGAAFFSTFSLVIACLVKTRERFMGIGQILTMPLFFASNAIYPISIMPGWLQGISHGNPLTYQVDALRSLMLAGGTSSYGIGFDFLVLTAACVAMIAIASRLYPKLVI